MIEKKINLAVLASGGGSNANRLAEYFQKHEYIQIAVFITNNPNSGVIKLGEEYNIPCEIITSSDIQQSDILLQRLSEYQVNYIILAGFLKKIPDALIASFNNRIINIHPSLLPKFGGKGMYGHRVHEAVKNSGEKVSGCTIHLVNEEYDQGKVLAQFHTDISPDMTAEDIGKAVLKLEHHHFSKVIEQYIRSRENFDS